MHLTFLSLTDFRSYKNAELVLRPGVTTFIGSNGEGKTNFAEAIGYLAYLSSHRTGSDTPLIRLGCERAYIRAKVMNDDREELLEIEINNGRANRGRINQSPSRSTKELLGHLRAVLFTPEDLSLVKGDPSERRDYLDKILISRTPRLAGTITDYEGVIKQRNSLLKTRPNERELVPWDGQLAKLASQVTAARLALVEELRPLVLNAYSKIAAGDDVNIEYKCSGDLKQREASEIEAEILLALPELRRAEIERGLSLIGPHRDDLLLTLGATPVRGYASQGESWSFALSLRVAAYHLFRSDGDLPILILDDVFAELDAARRKALVELIKDGEQVIVTAAVEEDLPQDLLHRKIYVRSGTLNE